MLIEKFPPSNCLIHKFRNKVLRLSLQGSQWIHAHQIQWAIVKKNDDQIEVKHQFAFNLDTRNLHIF